MKAMIDPVYAAVMMIENTQYVPENERHELVVGFSIFNTYLFSCRENPIEHHHKFSIPSP